MSALNDQLVLKEGDVFLLSHGNGEVSGTTGLGLYYQDTRFLSLFEFRLNGQLPPLLNFTSSQNFMGLLQLANDILKLPDGTIVLPQTISIRRSRFISQGLHERIELVNYNRFPVTLTVTLQFGADFRDLFDVRGFPREKWGELLAPVIEDGVLQLRYNGLDGLARGTHISFERPPDTMDIHMPERTTPIVEPGILVPVVGAPSYHIIIEPPTATVTWNLVLQPHIPEELALHIMPHTGDGGPPTETEVPEVAPDPQSVTLPERLSKGEADSRYSKAVGRMRRSYQNWETESSVISTGSEEFNSLLKRSAIDLRVLSTVQEGGIFPSAGIPWFVAPFGRDSLITALQTLMLNPQIAVGTLRTLVKYQGMKEDPWREEQPGKILHEMRMGEMVRLNLAPHSPYYGTVDATPLFVVLLVETMRWLNDDALYDELMPGLWRAIEWIDTYGDVDGDGFVEYIASKSKAGIRNQVWKDSEDSMQFPDGKLAETPIAAVEVQGYVYAAKKGLGELLSRKGHPEGERLIEEAETLKARFNKQFWMPELGFYTQGLDRDKRPVPTITTNPGHALWCGIADEDKARRTARRMMEPDVLSGWGLRTISANSPSYNPMSYHNGTVWPHDNSIVVAGFKRYGCTDEALTVIGQIAEVSRHFRYYRLPELYCGFPRDRVFHSGPAEYPVSCSPQAWVAGAPILMLQTMLGLQVDAALNQIRISPALPDWLPYVQISNLRIGGNRVDLRVESVQGQHEVFIESADSTIDLVVV